MALIAARTLMGPVQEATRRTSVVPSVLKPTARQLARLHEEDRRLLLCLLSTPLEYVDHALFHCPGVERMLFGRLHGPMAEGAAARGGSNAGASRAAAAVLAPAEEIRLFQRFNYCRLRQVRLLRRYRGKRMPMAKLRLLLMWAHRATATRCCIVEANMPLVLAMARRARPAGLDFNELISEGNFALLRSVDKFDCSRGFKFSTYACRAILKSFSRVMMRNGRYRNRFPVEFEPTLERSDYLERQRERQEGDAMEHMAVILADNRAALNAMEEQVIRERFALDPSMREDATRTLEQVGERIGVTKERVRQIQNRALRKLRTALEEDLWG